MSLYLIGHEHPAWPAGLTCRRLDLWTRRGYLRANNPNVGSGKARLWPRREADIATTMLRLTDAGMLPSAAEQVARAVLACTPDEPATVELAPGVALVIGPVSDRPTLAEELMPA